MPVSRPILASIALLVVAAGGWTIASSASTDRPVADTGWIDLFDGDSLTGWRAVGGDAAYTIDDGCILGVVGPGPNSFLRTERLFDDFELEIDLRLDETGNSGIQFRSHQRDGDGRVYGYQCEIDPSERAWSGGIYDEGRRGWLGPLEGDERAAARAAFHVDDWNHSRIVAEGDHLRTWVNGVACADLHDDADASGFIALQVHSGKTGRIRWRNLRLREIGPAAKATWGDDLARGAPRTFGDEGTSVTVTLDEPVVVDVIMMDEAITPTSGARVTRYVVESFDGKTWHEVAVGNAIGPRRVVQTTPVEAKAFRLTVERHVRKPDDAAAAPELPSFQLHKLPKDAPAATGT